MTLPTADEVRNEPAGRRLSAWVAEYVLGWRWIKVGLRPILVPPIQHECMSPEFVFSGLDGNTSHSDFPHTSTRPAACAELRRHLWVSGKYVEAMVATYYGTANGSDGVSVRLDEMVGADQHYHREPIGTDPIAAECLAWCKVALLAKIAETTAATT